MLLEQIRNNYLSPYKNEITDCQEGSGRAGEFGQRGQECPLGGFKVGRLPMPQYGKYLERALTGDLSLSGGQMTPQTAWTLCHCKRGTEILKVALTLQSS